MRKGFPNRILGFRYGWRDRGAVSGEYKGNDTYNYTCCGLCRARARIAINLKKERFLYCPKCLARLVDNLEQ